MSRKRTLVQAFMKVVQRTPHVEAILYRNAQDKTFIIETYQEIYEKVLKFSSFLQRLGTVKGENIGIFSDNVERWPIVDFSILGLGGIIIAKGTDSPVKEISFITNFCEIKKLILQNKEMVSSFIENYREYPTVKEVFVMYEEGVDFTLFEKLGIQAYSLQKILESSLTVDQARSVEDVFRKGEGDDIATIIFTAGTTGDPKGVMLSHYNMLWQFEESGDYIQVERGTRAFSILPIWHSFQRVANYIFLLGGGSIVYSKPIPQIMLRDIEQTNPSFMGCVPRLLIAIQEGVFKKINKASFFSQLIFKTFFKFSYWNITCSRLILNRIPEFTHRTPYILRFLAIFPYLFTLPFLLLGRALIFKPIKKRFGVKFKGFFSGGGKLPKKTEQFYAVLGFFIHDSFGLTEMGPVVSMPKAKGSLAGTVGAPYSTTEIEIRDEKGKPVPIGQKGLLFVRGPQLMKGGYYKRTDLTTQVITKDGWLDTGDLARQSRQGDLDIVGRLKDTIVLLNGKNIEPLPIEDALRESPLIDQAIVLGQDQKFLGVLLTLSPEAIEKYKSSDSKEVNDLMASEIRQFVNVKNGFKDYELITSFKILPHPFEVGKEISPKLEVKRHVVNELYKKEIAQLFS